MTPDEFADKVSDCLSVDEMKEDLEAVGVDVDGMIASVQGLLGGYERESAGLTDSSK